MRLSHDGRSGSSSGSNVENARRCTGWGASRGGTPTCLSCGSSACDRRLECRSRMRRESHVRFCEGGGVRAPSATRLIFDPLHYLALIEQKINALDQAAPLAGWRLPEEFMTLRRLMEARMGKQGKREFVQVLRLMEVFPLDEVAAAARDAIARGAIGFDAVKHLVLCRIERRPPRLEMTVYPYLPRADVAMTSAKTYLDLLTGASS